MCDYAVWDVETTGFNPDQDAITELGWLTVRDGIPGAVHSLLVRTAVPVPLEVTALTGITNELLAAEGLPLAEVLSAFLSDVADLPLIGHNVVRFDAPFLEAACALVGLPPPDRSRYVDTAALYKARCLGMRPGLRTHWQFATDVLAQRTPGLKYSLGHCCWRLGIDSTDVTAHRAAGDVTMAQRLYAQLSAEPVGVLQ